MLWCFVQCTYTQRGRYSACLGCLSPFWDLVALGKSRAASTFRHWYSTLDCRIIIEATNNEPKCVFTTSDLRMSDKGTVLRLAMGECKILLAITWSHESTL
jgi:hypothetical protein